VEDTVAGVAVRAKVLNFEASLDRAGRVSAEGCPPLELPDEWAAEHLVLAALLRCSLTSLRYHAARAGLDSVGSGSASGTITKRESDGRYAFVEVNAELDVAIDPAPETVLLADLLAKAERDCFIGASLTAKPRYRWRVNGEERDV
jgi:uncharacterized OsmC-like protein